MTSWKTSYMRYRAYLLSTLAQQKKNKEFKAYIEIVLSLITIIVLSLFALKPTLSTIAGLIKEIEVKESTIVALQQKIDNTTRAKQLYNREISKIALIDTALPTNPDSISLLQQIETLSNRDSSNLMFHSSDTVSIKGAAPAKTTTPLESIPVPSGALDFSVSNTFSSSYKPLITLLTDIENYRRLIMIDNISIKSEILDDSASLEMSVSGRGLFSEHSILNK